MYLPNVQLHETESLDEAGELMVRHAPDARFLAGGTDVLVDLKTGRLHVHHVISINGIPHLRDIVKGEDGLRIGAMVTVTELNRSAEIGDQFQVLRDAASRMAAPQVRNAATVGGNIAGAVPCADLPPVLMVLGARLEIWSPDGVRTSTIEEFLRGPRQTTLAPGEILTTIHVPQPEAGFGGAYERFSLREGNAIAVASVAAGVKFHPDMSVRDVSLALGAVAPMPKPVRSLHEFLAGRILDEESIDLAAAAAMEAAEPISDIRGSAEYRRELVGILTRRALRKAEDRVKGAAS